MSIHKQCYLECYQINLEISHAIGWVLTQPGVGGITDQYWGQSPLQGVFPDIN